MPKGKRKLKSGKYLHSKHELKVPTSEEESFVDNASIISNLSEVRIASDDDTLVVDADDEVIVTDDFEDKLKEAIDGTFQKNTKARQTCLETVRKALCSKYLYDFVTDRKITMCDMVERCLKRGKGEEQAIAAAVAALICLQLGAADSEVVFQGIHPLLVVILSDPAALPSVRAQCASSLGLCCFISCSGNEIIQSTMDSLYSVFSASFFKGNGVSPSFKPEISALHSSALLSWTLLLTILTPPYIMNLVNMHFKRLPELLESIDVELRIAAGESIAVFYELARQCREDFTGERIKELCNKLRLLATDSQKFRAKKDRRQQRSSFRDILRAVEEGEPPDDVRVKFGREVLLIESWCHKRQYDAFCQLLGSGMNLHLMENALLRDVFDLGSPLTYDNSTPRTSKFERHIANLAACKARTKSRNKQRDKRADVLC